jgi:hypothetical protein
MTELLGLGTGTGTGTKTPTLTPAAAAAAAGMHAKLVKADFHGSIVTGTCPCAYVLPTARQINRMHAKVRRSKNAALVGLSGIVVQETENTFKIVTRVDKLKGARFQGTVDLERLADGVGSFAEAGICVRFCRSGWYDWRWDDGARWLACRV